jgi:hypothetical protein
MSFILDALKKSESDRQRQGGPALFEVKVAAPRSALPLWAIAIAVLFVANLGVVLWLLLRHTAPAPASLAPPAAGSPVAAAPRAAPAVEPAVLVSTPAAAPAAPTAMPSAAAQVPGTEGAPAPATAAPTLNPDDYAPAAEAPPAASGSGHVTRGTEAGVPLYQQLAATPGAQTPQLRLDLLAYADRPGDRWALINMHKVKEGDSLPEGVRVDRITPSGAVLSYHGSQFLLTQ